jgi:hypothetical protein
MTCRPAPWASNRDHLQVHAPTACHERTLDTVTLVSFIDIAHLHASLQHVVQNVTLVTLTAQNIPTTRPAVTRPNHQCPSNADGLHRVSNHPPDGPHQAAEVAVSQRLRPSYLRPGCRLESRSEQVKQIQSAPAQANTIVAPKPRCCLSQQFAVHTLPTDPRGKPRLPPEFVSKPVGNFIL